MPHLIKINHLFITTFLIYFFPFNSLINISVFLQYFWLADFKINCSYLGFPGGSAGKQFTCNVGDLGPIPGLGGSPGGEHDDLLQYSCLENPHGERSLAGCSLWGCKELDTSELLSTGVMKHLQIQPITKPIYNSCNS